MEYQKKIMRFKAVHSEKRMLMKIFLNVDYSFEKKNAFSYTLRKKL